MGIPEEHCNCQSDKKSNNKNGKNINKVCDKGQKEVILFAPLKGKMKVLKKIKKRMGLGQYLLIFFARLNFVLKWRKFAFDKKKTCSSYFRNFAIFIALHMCRNLNNYGSFMF